MSSQAAFAVSSSETTNGVTFSSGASALSFKNTGAASATIQFDVDGSGNPTDTNDRTITVPADETVTLPEMGTRGYRGFTVNASGTTLLVLRIF